MNSAVRIKRTIKFGSGVDAKIYEEGLVLKPPLPVEIIDEFNAGSPNVELWETGKAKTRPIQDYDYVSEPRMKTPDMSRFKTTSVSTVKSDVGAEEKPEEEKPKPKLVRRVKLVRRRKKS